MRHTDRTHRPGTRATRWDRLRVLIAGGVMLGAGAAVTVAAYLDQAAVEFAPVGGSYDIAYVDPDGTLQQGNPEPYEIDMTDAPAIAEIGSGAGEPIDLTLRNAGDTDTGVVTFTLQSLLTGQPADDDGVLRDPFDVLLVSAWDPEGNLVADTVDAASLTLELDSWVGGEDRSVRLQFAYKADLGTPYYFGKNVRIGFIAQGVSA